MILSTVRRTLVERELVESGEHILVACSGGADSMALLHVLYRLRSQFGVTLCCASIDHAIRPESVNEVASVERLSRSLGVPFRSERLELSKPGVSLQARAREQRYAVLREIAADFKAARIAVGHTQNDQGETVLGRILRGAGLRGLSGIKPKRADGVIRPLIDCSRLAVRTYAADEGLAFIDDPSNVQTAFERVRIRNHILPELLREDPNVVAHLAAIADQSSEIIDYLETQLPVLATPDAHSVPITRLLEQPSVIRALWLRRWLLAQTGEAPARVHLVQTERLLHGRGKVLLGSGWSVCRIDDEICVEYGRTPFTRSHKG